MTSLGRVERPAVGQLESGVSETRNAGMLIVDAAGFLEVRALIPANSERAAKRVVEIEI
jgi:hypothetical protein